MIVPWKTIETTWVETWEHEKLLVEVYKLGSSIWSLGVMTDMHHKLFLIHVITVYAPSIPKIN